MAAVGDDCYYYYYSSCMKAEACRFRHSAPALGKEEVCPDWMKGACKTLNCPSRHMMNHKPRSSMACYYETQPTGCQKPHCPFKHSKVQAAVVANPSQAVPANSAVPVRAVPVRAVPVTSVPVKAVQPISRPTTTARGPPHPAVCAAGKPQPIAQGVAAKTVAPVQQQAAVKWTVAAKPTVPVARTTAAASTAGASPTAAPKKSAPGPVSIRITIPVEGKAQTPDSARMVRSKNEVTTSQRSQPQPQARPSASQQRASARPILDSSKPNSVARPTPGVVRNGSSFSITREVTNRTSFSTTASPRRTVTQNLSSGNSVMVQGHQTVQPTVQHPADRRPAIAGSRTVESRGSTQPIAKRRHTQEQAEGPATKRPRVEQRDNNRAAKVQILRDVNSSKEATRTQAVADTPAPAKLLTDQGISLKDVRARRFAQQNAKACAAKPPAKQCLSTPSSYAEKSSPSPSVPTQSAPVRSSAGSSGGGGGGGGMRIKTLKEIRAEKESTQAVSGHGATDDTVTSHTHVTSGAAKRRRLSRSGQPAVVEQPVQKTAPKKKQQSEAVTSLSVSEKPPPASALVRDPPVPISPTVLTPSEQFQPASRVSRDDSMHLEDMDLLDDAVFQKAMKEIGYDESFDDDDVDTNINDDDLLLEAEALL